MIPTFLPPAYVVRGKVIFILGNVCLFTTEGGGTPSPVPGLGGTPSQVWWWGGTPFQVWGVPYPRSACRGTPSQVLLGGGTPFEVWPGEVPHPRYGWGEYPIPGLASGVPHPRSGWGEYPIPGLAGGVPHLRSGGYPISGQGGTLGTPYPDLRWSSPT